MHEIQELTNLLDKQIAQHKDAIIKDAIHFNKCLYTYRNIQYSDSFGIILKKESAGKIKSVGFPFPLISFPLNIKEIPPSISINVFLRGGPLRNFQKNQLIKEIGEMGSIEIRRIYDLVEFRKITKKLCQNYKSFNYFDPYTFIGDSFIGSYIANNFSKYFGLKLKYFYSENYLNLDVLYETKSYVRAIEDYNESCLAIFSDLIDIHWDRTKHIAKNLAKKGIASIICGRNIIIEPSVGKIVIYLLMSDDILLRNKNIEDYMAECLNPFLIPSGFGIVPINLSYHNLIINPFGSELNKNLPEGLIFKIIKNYKEDHPNSKIVIISGFRNSYIHMLKCANLRGKLIENDFSDGIIFKNYGSFREIKDEIGKYKVSVGLTADTSIAHLFNAIGIRNITFYNISRCDTKSSQSLASDSPLGFCRYGKIQFPCLFNEKNIESKEFINSVVALLKHLNGPDLPCPNQGYIKKLGELLVYPSKEKHDSLVYEYNKNLEKSNIGWLNNIYDPTALTNYLGPDGKSLLIANWKICPLTKFGGLS